jgi:hypothetical protein
MSEDSLADTFSLAQTKLGVLDVRSDILCNICDPDIVIRMLLRQSSYQHYAQINDVIFFKKSPVMDIVYDM